MSLIPYTVAIAGFGTVGGAVARSLSSGLHPSLKLTHILNRRVERKKVDWVPRTVQWTDRFEDILDSGVDVFVELIGGLSPAEEWVRRALESGKSVVTANKQLIAHRGAELIDLASSHGASLRFEASVAGGIPVVRAIQEGLAGDTLTRVSGILNGTCNYILSRMSRSDLAFGDALREARTLGYAEADPSDDLDGVDARAKLAILAAIGLHRRLVVSDIPCRSISGVDGVDFAWARRLKCTIRQVSWAEVSPSGAPSVVAWVSPALVPEDSPFAAVERNQNLVVVRGDRGGDSVFGGLGSGGDPTAVAVVSDLLTVAGRRRTGGDALRLPEAVEPVRRDFVAPCYFRFKIATGSTLPAAFRETLAEHQVAIDRTLQHPDAGSSWNAVLTLAPCQWRDLERAIGALEGLSLVERPFHLPIIDTVDSVRAERAGSAAR